MTDPDPFDEIVQHLNLDWSVADAEAMPLTDQPVEPPAPPPPTINDPEAEPFYRHIEPREPTPHRPGVLLAWLGILSGPAVIMLAGLIHFIVPRPLLLGLALVFVASAVYLFSQLPERGPAEPFWPDDGAQL
jgi:hypothetical protein